MVLNNSPHRCGEPPTPDEAKLMPPDFDFASAISSLTLVAGTLLLTTIKYGITAMRAIGAKSRVAS